MCMKPLEKCICIGLLCQCAVVSVDVAMCPVVSGSCLPLSVPSCTRSQSSSNSTPDKRVKSHSLIAKLLTRAALGLYLGCTCMPSRISNHCHNVNSHYAERD